jgi:hypothetical protein
MIVAELVVVNTVLDRKLSQARTPTTFALSQTIC